MKKLLLMTAALVATSGVFAKKVKFIVDMTGRTVSPNGVSVAGNFQNWTPANSPLTKEGATMLYSTVVDINARQVIEFKFINDNNWGPGEEQVPTISKKESVANGGANGNRWAYIDSLKNDTTIISFAFSGSAPRGKSAIRFAVDMQKVTAVSANGVYVAGNFQGKYNNASGDWKPNESRMINLFNNNKVYEFIAIVDTTDGVEWKYINDNNWGAGEESIPTACQKGGGNSNRFYQATSTSTAFPKICFSMCVACPSAPIPTYDLTFQVDMSSSDCNGGFDSVTVAGAGAKLTGFGVGIRMAQVGATGVYRVTVMGLDSGEAKFKFRAHKNGNTNWEGGSDRILNLTKNDTVALTCLGSRVVGPCASKPANSSITFYVDMIAETPAPKIYIMGTFAVPNWQAGARELTAVSGVPGLYMVKIDSICPGTFNYKFTNGDATNKDNEEQFGDSTQRSCVESNGIGGWNRVFTRAVATPISINYKFNTCTIGRAPVGINENILSANLKLYPNPTSTYTVIEFNDNSANHNVQLLDLAGRVVRTYDNHKYNTLRVDKDELTPGIYFLNVSNDKNQTGSIKLLVN